MDNIRTKLHSIDFDRFLIRLSVFILAFAGVACFIYGTSNGLGGLIFGSLAALLLWNCAAAVASTLDPNV